MTLKLKFNPKDWDEINNYLKEWDKWNKSGRPDNTSDAIYLVPFTIALIKSSKTINRLTWILIGLTLILALQNFILFLR